MTMPTAEHVRALFVAGELDLPLPGGGATATRLRRLCDLARQSPIGVARLAEAHSDAVAILGEARRDPRPDALYGVWASQHDTLGVAYDDGSNTVSGTMGFASGLGIVDRALVTARTPDGTILIDVDVSDSQLDSVSFDTGGWASPALADTATGPIAFTDHHVDRVDVIADPGWYLRRVGFWQGACGPAACWAGGALGLVDAADRYVDDDPHRRAHHGALLSHAWTLAAVIDAAGDQIDVAPQSCVTAERAARSLRFTVATMCRDVLDRFGRAFGPRPYVQDGTIAQRALDLDMYVKQHHGERELPAVSTLHSSS